MQKDLITTTYQHCIKEYRLRGDMIMVFKIVTGVMDSKVLRKCIGSHSVTRENRCKLIQKHVHYNLTKITFAILLAFSTWNNLPM